MSRAMRMIVVLLGWTSLGACADLPSVEPFAGATRALGPAIDAAYDAAEDAQRDVVEQLEAVDDSGFTPDQKDALASLIADNATLVDRIEEERRYRAYVAGALADYAASLAAIAEAGKSGAQSAEQVADALGGLLDRFSGLVPGAGAVKIPSTVTDVAKGLYQEIAKVRAARAMDKALAAAHPIIERLGAELSAESPELLRIVENATDSSRRAVELAYTSELNYRKALLKERDGLYKQIRETLEGNGEDAQATVLSLEARLATYDEMITRTDQWHADVEQRLRESREAGEAARRVIRAASEAIDVWVQEHASLVSAFQQNRGVDVTSLVNTVDRLRRLAHQAGG